MARLPLLSLLLMGPSFQTKRGTTRQVIGAARRGGGRAAGVSVVVAEQRPESNGQTERQASGDRRR